MKYNTPKISILTLSLLAVTSSAIAQQAANLAINPGIPATQTASPAVVTAGPAVVQAAPPASSPPVIQSAPVVSAVVVPAQAGTPAVATEAQPSAKKESVNPFTGKTYGAEATQRDIEQIRLNNSMNQELIKKRKDELEMFKLEQEAQKLIRGDVGSKSGTATVPPISATPMPLNISSPQQPAPVAQKSIKELAEEERLARAAEKPLEPVMYFDPPTERNISEPKLVGIVQNESVKVAILSYNGVTIRVPEGGSVAGHAVTGIANGKAMWGNRPLFATSYVDGARVERTDFEIPAGGQTPQTANAIKAIKEGDDAKRALKAGLNVGLAPSGRTAAPNQGNAMNQPVSNNSPANRLPPPPPVVNR